MVTRNDLLDFCTRLPKAELHAHLNGSLSVSTIQKLAEMKKWRDPSYSGLSDSEQKLLVVSSDQTLAEAFRVFPLVHSLTDYPEAVTLITREVIRDFATDNVVYLELRSTPKSCKGMTKEDYVKAMIEGVRLADADVTCTVRLLLSVDRRETVEAARQTVSLALQYKHDESDVSDSGGFVVGLDVCGHPEVDGSHLLPELIRAKKAGLKLTPHLAESDKCLDELKMFLDDSLFPGPSLLPDRIGHGTLLLDCDKMFVERVKRAATPIEICISSNVKCGTVTSYADHHMGSWLKDDHPICICTDDKGIFETSLSEEYYLAGRHFNLDKGDLYHLSLVSLDAAFLPIRLKERLKEKHWTNFMNCRL